jgi:hypothetical protein
MKRSSRRLDLVLIGALASPALLTGCGSDAPPPAAADPVPTLETASRDLYQSEQDCKADWGAEADKCAVAPASDFDPQGLDQAGIKPNPDGSLGFAGDGGTSGAARSTFFYGPLYYGPRQGYLSSNRAVASMHGNGNKSIYNPLGFDVHANRASNGVAPSMRSALATTAGARALSASRSRSPAASSGSSGRSGFGSTASRSSSSGG